MERKGPVEAIRYSNWAIFCSYFRWVRFEEIAETVLGRWSKPHVATLMQTSLTDLKILLQKGVILLNVQSTDLPALSRKFQRKEKTFFFSPKKICLISFLEIMVQAMTDAQYIDSAANAQKLNWILGLPHFHHHEKRSVTKTASSVSLSKQGLHPSPSFVINSLTRRGLYHLSQSFIALSSLNR